MAISAQLSRWAVLGLVACDDSYRPALIPEGPLRTYLDSDPEIDLLDPQLLARSGIASRPGSNNEMIIDGWKIVTSFDDAGTGFGAVIFRNDDENRAIVAFRGTNGLDWQDWWTNVNLGGQQWTNNRVRITNALKGLTDAQRAPFQGEILFTGQSLGGALAQYALEDYAIAKGNAFDPSKTKLITYNGLGALDGRGQFFGASPVDPRLASVETAHFYITNDLVSRLGGGDINGDTSSYNLPFYDFVNDIEARDVETGLPYTIPGGTPALDIADAHRIESGFYRGFRIFGGDFRDAGDPEPIDYIDAESVRDAGAAFAGLFAKKSAYSPEAYLRTAGAALAMVALAPADKTAQLMRDVSGHLRASSVTPDAAIWRVVDNAAFALEHSRLLAASTKSAALAAATVATSAAVLLHRDDSIAAEMQAHVRAVDFPAGSLDDNMLQALTGTGNDEEIVAKTATAIALMADDFPGQTFDILAQAAEPTVLVNALARDDWQAGILELGAEQAQAANADFGKMMAELVIGIDSVSSPVVEEFGQASSASRFKSELANAASSTAKGIANAFSELTQKFADTAFDLGSSLSFVNLQRIIRGLDGALSPIGSAGAAPLPEMLKSASAGAIKDLQDALGTLEQAGQMIVVRPGRGTNPFDDPAFIQENAVASDGLKEGQVRTFTAYLPYDAAAGGQHISFQLTGSAASKLEVLIDADPLVVGPDNEFDLLVPESSRQITFGLRTAQDVDVDETLGISAQLVDSSGNATHQSHLELNLALDATVESSTTPTNVIAGTTLDDNRLSTGGRHPLVGTSAADRLQALAGRDELSGNGGDDVLEGGGGNDIADGGDGDDRVFANAMLDEPSLRNYIDATASIVDATHPTSTLTIANGAWLRGGMGDDAVVGDATDDMLFGGGGSDLIVGGAGHDIIDGDDDYEVSTISSGTVTRDYGGFPFSDTFSPPVFVHNYAGDVGAGDEIHAGAGDDLVIALRGDDTVFGDNGNDTISGDDGDDSLFGGAGNDRITGDSYDYVRPGQTTTPVGNDYVDGGDGDDVLYGDGGADVLVGGNGDDVIRGNNDLRSTDGLSASAAQAGDDYLSGGAGRDTLIGDAGNDTLIGGDGDDRLFGDSDQTPIALFGNDYLDGGAGSDYLRGYGGDDELIGGEGADQLLGEAGNDRLDGGVDDDVLSGGDGDDVLIGGGGYDELLGGNGDDRLEGWHSWGEAGNDTLVGGEYLDGGDGDDTLLGAAGANTLIGGAGRDVLDGGAEYDTLLGGVDDDMLHGGDDVDSPEQRVVF